MNSRMYLLEVELLGVSPKISRRFVVPCDIPLDRLHDVIQIVMGWKNYHCYEFTIRKQQYTEQPEEIHHGKDAREFRLVDLIKQNKSTFDYLYDFGDNWNHQITIVKSRYIDPAPHPFQDQVYCLEGHGMCPPEDVGGTWGFENFKQIMFDPSDEEHEDMVSWYTHHPGGYREFDPNFFSEAMVNLDLGLYFRASRPHFLGLPWHSLE